MGHLLPLEVLENIMQFLTSLEDRKSFGLVCTQWYQAFLKPSLRDQEIVRFDNDKDFKSFQKMNQPNLKYMHFEFTEMEITREGTSMHFWKTHGENIKSLSIRNCYLGDGTLPEALSYCTSLEVLTLKECKDLFMSGIFLDTLKNYEQVRRSLRQVRELYLGHNRYMTDAIIYRILEMCPDVNSLDLSGCQISYHAGTYNKFYPKGSPPSESVATFPIILETIERHAAGINSLNFSETLIDNNSLLNLALSTKLKVRQLHLRGCLQISDLGIIQMCATNNVSELTVLDIGGCDRITDECLVAICNTLSHLTTLSVQGCKNISDTGIANISHLKQLECFKGGQCNTIQGVGLINGLAKKVNHAIKEISLNQMGNLSEDALVEVIKHAPELRCLDVSGSLEAVTDTALRAIFKYCRKLRSLNLGQCDYITDSGLTGIPLNHSITTKDSSQPFRIPLGSRQERGIRRDAQIKEQVKELCERFDGSPTEESEHSLARLQGLRRLILSGCMRVTDVSLNHVFAFKELQYLDMSSCQQISHIGLKQMVQTCKSIEHLDLSLCHNLNNEAVEAVLRGLPRLKKLRIGSDIITNDIVSYFYDSRVTNLDVRQCTKVTPDGITQLRQIVPTLRALKYHETPMLESDVKPPKPPSFKFWKWRSK